MPTSYLIVAFLASCLLSLLYWQIIQPVLLIGIRFRLFERRDELRTLAIAGKENFEAPAYRELESFICKILAVVPCISLASFIWFVLRNSDAKDNDMERFRKEASPELKRMVHKSAHDALIIMLLNSPIITFFALVFIFAMWIAGKLNRLLIYRKAENFIDDLPNNVDGDSSLPAAA